MSNNDKIKPETVAAQALHYIDPQTGGIVPPLQPSTTFARDHEYELINTRFSYARDENPAYTTAETVIAHLECAVDARLFSSGMAAAAAVVQSLRPGDHLLAPKVMYWGLRGWLIEFCASWGVALSFFDPSVDGDLAAKIINGKTRLLWIESPCNPTWELIDIAAAAELAKKAGAVLAVDSTVATPVLTRPIELGADIVMHSATKYLNGHGDVVAGVLATAGDSELWQRILKHRASAGAVLGTFEAWLLQRGMRTLFVRVQRACESAMAIAKHLDGHAAVDAVLYPGLASHPGHDIAARQMIGGFGGMLSIRVKGGAREALRVANQCKVFIRATSLGGVESLIEHRYSIEGAGSPVPANLLRLSIGMESLSDLLDDLDQALDKVV